MASDFVWYINDFGERQLGQISFVRRDKRRITEDDGTVGQIKVCVHQVYSSNKLLGALQLVVDAARPKLRTTQHELILVENDEPLCIPDSQLAQLELAVFLNHHYSTDTLSPPVIVPYIIHHMYSEGEKPSIRIVALSHPLRGKLKIVTYTRCHRQTRWE
jgi:hypothetical protein